VAALGPLLHNSNSNFQVIIVAASFALYFLVPSIFALIVFVALRAWLGVAVTSVILLAMVPAVVPAYTAQQVPAGASQGLTVFSGNLRYGLADAHDLVTRATQGGADVLTFQELTIGEANHLESAGIGRQYPYSYLALGQLDLGVGIWSKYPLADEHNYPGFYDHEVSARISFGSPAVSVTVFSTHLITPAPPPARRWVGELKMLGSILHAQQGVVVDAGDFNATLDHSQFRRLLSASGYQDGASQAGSGLIRTFPANEHFPPLIGIDHVLTRGAVATKVYTVSLPGSDHRGLIAKISIPAK
jgi:endonuclease/exonuclease/phosphatase (EEP) superfamily protein YafD